MTQAEREEKLNKIITETALGFFGTWEGDAKDIIGELKTAQIASYVEGFHPVRNFEWDNGKQVYEMIQAMKYELRAFHQKTTNL